MPSLPNDRGDSPSASGRGAFRSAGPLGAETGSTCGPLPLGRNPFNTAGWLDSPTSATPLARRNSLGLMERKSFSATLTQIFNPADPPDALFDWERRVSDWCGEYENKFGGAGLSEIKVDTAVFVFDETLGRVVLAYAVSVQQLMKRDSGRMAGFLRGKKDEKTFRQSVKETLKDDTFIADKGHFLGHASGGILDINLFPQRKELNEGHSAEGKQFRTMEKYVADNLGTFFYHRPIYDDESWIPQKLQYGVLKGGKDWWEREFSNKKSGQPSSKR